MKILIADNQSKVQHALSVLLKEHSGWSITGYASNTCDLHKKVAEQTPDVLLMDWGLSSKFHGDFIASLRKLVPGLIIIMLSTDPEVRQLAMRLRVDFFISKVDPPMKLLDVLRDCEKRITNSV